MPLLLSLEERRELACPIKEGQPLPKGNIIWMNPDVLDRAKQVAVEHRRRLSIPKPCVFLRVARWWWRLFVSYLLDPIAPAFSWIRPLASRSLKAVLHATHRRHGRFADEQEGDVSDESYHTVGVNDVKGPGTMHPSVAQPDSAELAPCDPHRTTPLPENDCWLTVEGPGYYDDPYTHRRIWSTPSYATPTRRPMTMTEGLSHQIWVAQVKDWAVRHNRLVDILDHSRQHPPAPLCGPA